jgi:hypothetical protein
MLVGRIRPHDVGHGAVWRCISRVRIEQPLGTDDHDVRAGLDPIVICRGLG